MIKRELYLNKIVRLIDKDPIKIITGVRRSGKTYLLKSICEELKNINEYTKNYHHGEDQTSSASNDIDSQELEGYIKNTLKIINPF